MTCTTADYAIRVDFSDNWYESFNEMKRKEKKVVDIDTFISRLIVEKLKQLPPVLDQSHKLHQNHKFDED